MFACCVLNRVGVTPLDLTGADADNIEVSIEVQGTQFSFVVTEYVTERGVVGISTMICRRGQIVHDEQFGFQDKEAGVPMADPLWVSIVPFWSMTLATPRSRC